MTDAAKRHSRKGLYLPLIAAVLVVGGWTGWWFWLAHQVETRLAAQEDVWRDAGWTVAHQPASVTGWPFRVRMDVRELSVAAPSGQGVEAPRLLVEAAAWEPLKWVGFAPDGLALVRPGKGRVRLTGEALRFSVSHIDQPVPDLRIQLHDVAFTAETGAEAFPLASAELIHFQARPHADAQGGVLAGQAAVLFRLIEARGRPSGPVQSLARDGALTLEGQGVIENLPGLSASDPLGPVAGWSRSGGALTHVSGRLVAGDSRAVFESPRLAADADGRLAGTLSLSAEGAGEALAGLASAPTGAVDRTGAQAAAAAAGPAPADPETGRPSEAAARPIDLVFRNGRAWLGPFALAPAPKLF